MYSFRFARLAPGDEMWTTGLLPQFTGTSTPDFENGRTKEFFMVESPQPCQYVRIQAYSYQYLHVTGCIFKYDPSARWICSSAEDPERQGHPLLRHKPSPFSRLGAHKATVDMEF
jgi:hypothetical protein